MPSNGSRRMSAGTGMQSVGGRLPGQTQGSHYGYSQHTGSGRIMPRSGSDQHLPRVDYTSITTPARHTLLRSSLKTGAFKILNIFFCMWFVQKLSRAEICVPKLGPGQGHGKILSRNGSV